MRYLMSRPNKKERTAPELCAELRLIRDRLREIVRAMPEATGVHKAYYSDICSGADDAADALSEYQ